MCIPMISIYIYIYIWIHARGPCTVEPKGLRQTGVHHPPYGYTHDDSARCKVVLRLSSKMLYFLVGCV